MSPPRRTRRQREALRGGSPTRNLPALSFLVSGGRRRQVRRVHDQRRIVILDRYPAGLLVVILGILFLSLTDAFLTLNLIEHGASEINPVMAYFLEKGPFLFTVVKYGLTTAWR